MATSLLDTFRNPLGHDEPLDQEFLREAATFDEQLLNGYELYEEYYEGQKRPRLSDRQRRFLEHSGLPYGENFCETIVDTLQARVQITGVQAGEALQPISDWLTQDVWPRNEMPLVQGQVHNGTFVKGDGYVIVDFDPDEGLPTIRRQRAERIKPVYSEDDDELEYVVKTWSTCTESPSNPDGRRVRRMNLYYADRIEKYYAVSTGESALWERWLDLDDTEPVIDDDGGLVIGDDGSQAITGTWPTPWTMDGTPEGEPIGIQIVHFKPRPRDEEMGRSEMRSLIPHQDALTKQLLDLFDVMDQQGWGQRYATGIAETEKITVAIGEYLRASDPNAKFGQIPAAELKPIVDSIDATLRRWALASSTPIHLMTAGGALPSGESLKTAEAPQVKKAEDRMLSLGASWARVNRLCVRVTAAFGTLPAGVDEDAALRAHIPVLWEDAQSRNELDETNMLAVHHDLGVSRATILRKLGYDPDAEEQARAAEDAAAAPPPPHVDPNAPPVDPAQDPAAHAA